ncbi:RING finger protein PSH1 isoform X1 [Carassius auratus]|uniref:RING finger protein PSH1-like isoform X1 n=2 Tax=Carassius auratus TaxID=7957 RepID=A0A6P6MUI9_CARAU|nr:RING finger protein PSH1-like isoform X1 [Carassius auratus]XP_026100009.1 RING finger protein PSH1-like isoform X1 [Carassius auratus]
MSLKKTRDFKSHSKRRRSESKSTANNLAELPSERQNKSPKSKRAASPTPSYLSMRTDWSMDPPGNFKGGETFPLHSRVRAASPTSTCMSLNTDWSMDPPTNFRAAETLPLGPRLLTEHHFRCPLCTSILKDPVSTSCGHNYCRGCINEFWDSCAGYYVCPQCGNPSETRPVLNTNAALAEVVKNLQQAGFSPALPPQSYARAEDVACDFCTERRLKAVKCCLTCDVSLCETHIKQHYTIPALQKHTLSDVKTRPSQQCQNTDNSFRSISSGQQDHTDKTVDIIKEMAVRSIFESVLKPAKLQTQPKRPAKPKTRDNKEVRNLARMCSTLKQEVSGLKKRLSKRKNTKKEKCYEEEEDEDCSEKDSDESSDDEGDSDSSDEGEDGSENSSDEEEDGSENSSDEEEDGSENSSDEEEDGSDEEDGEEDSRDDEEDNSACSDEGSDDKYSEGYNDHGSDEYNSEDDDY